MKHGSHDPRRKAGLGLLLAFAAFAAIGPIGGAGAAVNQADAPVVAQAVGGDSGTASTTSDPLQYGVGDSALAGFPTAAPSFGVLSSGDVEAADDPNDQTGTSTAFGNTDPARGEAQDPATLTVNFVAPGSVNCLNLDFKFLSEEFPEFVNAGFNDAFIAELDTSTWTLAVDPVTFQTSISAPDDFAAGYGDRVSVDTVGPTVVTEADATGTTYDAATGVLTAKTPVAPGPHSIYLSVFDSGDTIYDSAVFADNLRFTNEPKSACQSPDLFGGATGVTPEDKSINFAGKTGTFDLTCTLPVESTDPCVGNAVISATIPGNLSKRAKSKKVAKGKYSVPPATTGQATVKLSKKGKKLLAKAGKLKGKLKIKNTVNGATSSSKIKLKK